MLVPPSALSGGRSIKVTGAHSVRPTVAYEAQDCHGTNPEYDALQR